ncbi:MAG TPA: DUF1638 domain-containing protein [Acidimicrobiia bacterium]|nr:DUF1638 domain-containing protein [Acidimicrobiia bacterium]
MEEPDRLLVIACGALARELLDVIKLNHLGWVDVECLPAILHNTPQLITDAVEERLDRATGRYSQVFVGYADCGTGGMLDRMLERRGVQRLPGAHCYEFFAGSVQFAALHDADPATFYLTDYLAKHFDRLVWHGLGLDRWPQLRDEYFRNYRRLVYLSQTNRPELVTGAAEAADRLGLEFEHVHVGYGDFQPVLVEIANRGGEAA